MAPPDPLPYAVRVKSSEYHLWKRDEPLMSSFDMELTERCNNNCIHCYINQPADDPSRDRELSTEEVKRILSEAVDLGALSVRFTGGEPLLRDDFSEMYLFARRSGLKVMLFTNACLITPELADLFARIPPLLKIEVSVYGITRKSYEAVSRVRGSYDHFMHGIDLLLDRKIPFVVKGVALPQNRDERERIEAWAATIPGMDTPISFTSEFELRGRRDSKAKNRVIQRLRPSPEESMSILTRNREQYVEGMKQFCKRFLVTSGATIFSCGAGQKICVDAYGYAQPCLLLRHPDLVFDLKLGSMKDALVFFSTHLCAMRTENPAYLDRCARCFLKGLCGQCPAMSWMEHGDLDSPVEYLCHAAHFCALDLGLLKPGEKAWEVEDVAERVQRFIES